MDYKFFIGADIAKNTIDFAIMQESRLINQERIKNDKDSIKSFLKQVKLKLKVGGKNSLFCLEATSHYDKVLIQSLKSVKANVWVESGLGIKRSLGLQRGKTDKVDSERIASYAYTFRHKARLLQQPRQVILRLRLLSSLRERLQKGLYGFDHAVKEFDNFLPKRLLNEVKCYYKQTSNGLREDLERTENAIQNTIQEDERLRRLFEIITSVRGAGKFLATELLIYTNEFVSFSSAKQFACYCGVAPFEYSSGISVYAKPRVSKLANKRMKKALFFPALASTRCKGPLQDYYKRKVAEGKPKMSVLNAVKNKLLQHIFTCVKENRLYNLDYSPNTVNKITSSSTNVN